MAIECSHTLINVHELCQNAQITFSCTCTSMCCFICVFDVALTVVLTGWPYWQETTVRVTSEIRWLPSAARSKIWRVCACTTSYTCTCLLITFHLLCFIKVLNWHIFDLHCDIPLMLYGEVVIMLFCVSVCRTTLEHVNSSVMLRLC